MWAGPQRTPGPFKRWAFCQARLGEDRGAAFGTLEAGFDPAHAEAAKAAMEQAIPLGRYGESEEIASLVLFLASDESRFITGAQYLIDGGMGAQ